MKKCAPVDSVKLMRSARARLAQRCQSMTYSEQRAYLDALLKQEKTGTPGGKKSR